MIDNVWYRVIGDVKDYIDAELGGVEDLTAVTAVAPHVKNGRTKKLLTGAVLSAPNRTIRIQLGTTAGGWLGTEATVGEWRVHAQLTFVDGTIKTWPEQGAGLLVIGPQYDP